MLFTDHLTLDAPRKNPETGFMAVRAKAARTGVYDYSGVEVDPTNAHGLRDQATVKVLRDAEQVFDARAAHSFIGKPITDNHPAQAVTSTNWKDHARGTIMGAKWEEGGYLAFDLLLTDASAIAAVDGGKRELSNGYSCDLQFGDFTAADGTKCQAKQVGIVGNHIALVDRGRAGPDCRIADAATCDTAPRSIFDSLTTQEKPVKTMLIDGLTVDVSNADTAVATIQTLLAARDTATGKVTGLENQVAALTTDKATLEGQVKDFTDAKPTPAQLRDAAKAYALVVDKAKANGVAVTDAMDEAAIIKATVLKHLGTMADSAKEWTDAQFASSFAMLKDANTVVPPGAPIVIGDAAAEYETARAKQKSDMSDAWRKPFAVQTAA
jgi:hypothetical protein